MVEMRHGERIALGILGYFRATDRSQVESATDKGCEGFALFAASFSAALTVPVSKLLDLEGDRIPIFRVKMAIFHLKIQLSAKLFLVRDLLPPWKEV